MADGTQPKPPQSAGKGAKGAPTRRNAEDVTSAIDPSSFFEPPAGPPPQAIEMDSANPHTVRRSGIARLAAHLVATLDVQPVDYELKLTETSFAEITNPSAPASPTDSKKAVRFPRLRLEELEQARPGQHAFYCPRQWGWTAAIPLEAFPAACTQPDAQGQDLGFTQEGAICRSHAFVRLERKIDAASLRDVSFQPTSLWGEGGGWDPSGAKGTQSGARGWWDMWACVSCGAGVAVAPSSALIPGVFPPRDAEALTKVRYDHPEIGQKPETSVFKAWETIFMVLINALLLDKRDWLPITGNNLRRRLPWDKNSERVWNALGCNLVNEGDGAFISPPSLDVRAAEGRFRRAQWIRATLEIGLFLQDWAQRYKSAVEKPSGAKYGNPFILTSNPLSGPILAAFGGDTVARSKITNSAPSTITAEAYASLGITPDVEDAVVHAAYQAQCRVQPDLAMFHFDALTEIADSRAPQRPGLADIVRQEKHAGAFGRRDYEGALEMICGSPNSSLTEEAIMERFVAHLESHPDEGRNLMNALQIVARARRSDLLQATLQSTSQRLRADLTLAQAYERLCVGESTEDELILTAYEVAVSDQPGRKESLHDALSVIGEHRKSQEIGHFLEHGTKADPSQMQLVLARPVSKELPAGLNNIGNTCYLNSLLQFLFSVKQLRDVILNFEEYQQDDTVEDKRVGGRLVSPAEIRRSRKFVALLKELFHAMIHSALPAVTPQKDLAYLALVSSKDDEQDEATANPSSTSTDATLVDEPGFIGPQLPPTHQPPPYPADTPSDAASPSSVLGKRKSDSGDAIPPAPESVDGTAMDVDSPPRSRSSRLSRQDTDITMAQELATKLESPSTIRRERSQTLQAEPRPTDVEIAPRAQSMPQPPVVIDLTKEDQPPAASSAPPLPPRPPKRSLTVADSGTAMLFGRQNDVSECMDNCLFQIQAALDDKKMVTAVGQDSNIVKSLFYGTTKQSLVFEKPDAKTSVKEEQFAYLLVDVAEEGRDLYDALDNVFDETEVEVEGGQAKRRVSLVDLPPVLQIQLQRVQFDRATSSVYKSNAYLKFEDRLHMDRYVEPEASDEEAIGRWQATLEHRKAMEQLRGRASALAAPLPGDKRAPEAILKDLATTLSAPNAPFVELFDGILGPDDVASLKTEAETLEAEARVTREKLSGLRKEVDGLWAHTRAPGAEYRLVSLFIHQGTASGGHYWALQRNLPNAADVWLNYNDSTVNTNISDDRIFMDSKGQPANPYWLTYVRVGEEDRFEMLRREFDS